MVVPWWGLESQVVTFVLLVVALSLRFCKGFSLVTARGEYSLVAVPGLLTAVASLVSEHSLQVLGLQ